MESTEIGLGKKRKFFDMENDSDEPPSEAKKVEKTKFKDKNSNLDIQAKLITNNILECYKDKIKRTDNGEIIAMRKDCVLFEGIVQHGSRCDCMEAE